jgi:hypothetical protein
MWFKKPNDPKVGGHEYHRRISILSRRDKLSLENTINKYWSSVGAAYYFVFFVV